MLNPDGHHIVEAGGGQQPLLPAQERQQHQRLHHLAARPAATSSAPTTTATSPSCGAAAAARAASPATRPIAARRPGSEDETQAVMNKIRTLIPDQRGPNNTDAAPITTTGVSRACTPTPSLNLYPWGWTTTAPPNGTDLANIGAHMSATNAGGQRLPVLPAAQLPLRGGRRLRSTGPTASWAWPPITTEIGGSNFFPTYSTMIDESGTQNQGMLIYLAKIARTPYLTTRGPDANSVAASPPASPGHPVHLTATINYAWTGNAYTQNVAAAEYYVDTPPWAGGTAIAMTARRHVQLDHRGRHGHGAHRQPERGPAYPVRARAGRQQLSAATRAGGRSRPSSLTSPSPGRPTRRPTPRRPARRHADQHRRPIRPPRPTRPRRAAVQRGADQRRLRERHQPWVHRRQRPRDRRHHPPAHRHAQRPAWAATTAPPTRSTSRSPSRPPPPRPR